MKKSTKGALAAGAAAVLLMGGAGTLAYWQADQSVDGGTLTSGKLQLGAGTCGDWTLDGGTALGAKKIVPGDSLTKLCTFPITAQGAHLTADVTLTGGNNITVTGGNTDATGANITASAAFKVGTTAASATTTSTITEANDGNNVYATITVNFPYGANSTANAENGNGTQNLTATLNSVAVQLKQKTH